MTKNIFIPISISHSPVNPTTDICVVFRYTQRLHNVSLEGWFTEDIPKLSTKFVHRTVKVGKESDIVLRKNQLMEDLNKLNKEENLVLIGGFHDANKDLQMLFYKLDKPSSIDLKIEHHCSGLAGSTGESDLQAPVESLVN